MKYGIALPYTTPGTVARLSQLAEESGWDGCFLGDAIWCEDPMIGLAAAAMVTNRVRLGTMITPAPLRKPFDFHGNHFHLQLTHVRSDYHFIRPLK